MATPGNGIFDWLPPIEEGFDIVAIATLGNGIFDWLPPMEVGGAIVNGRAGMAGDSGDGEDGFCPGINGPVLTSVMRVSMRRVIIFHSPHQSSSRTCGQTPSIMYDFALMGCSIGEARRH